MKQTTQRITQEMIDTVFSKKDLRNKFTHPRKDKAICEMRLSEMIYTDIAKRYKVSQFYVIQCVRRVARLYRVFVEGEQT